MQTIPPEWPPIQRLIERPDDDRLVALLHALDPQQRRGMEAVLKSYARERQRDFAGRFDSTSMSIVGVAVLRDPAAVASWLRRWRLGRQPRRTRDRVRTLLEERDPAWLAKLAGHLADRLSTERRTDRDLFEVVELLRRKTGIAPPHSDGYVAQLIYSRWARVRAAIWEDSRYAELFPRIFDIDAIGLHLDWATDQVDRLVGLTRDGLVDRQVFLDACLARLQRPGRPHATRAYLRIYEALGPSIDEVTGRLRDYLALLPDSLSTVAAVAQRELEGVDDADGLTAAQMAEATSSVLARSEKKLHRAQLAWLTRHVERHPEVAEPLVQAVATGFGSSSVDLQRGAVTWIAARLASVPVAVRDDVLSKAPALPNDLRDVLVTASGQPRRDMIASMSGPSVRLTPPTRQELKRVDSAEELAELLLPAGGRDMEGPTVERVLEGLIRYADQDRHVLRRALVPVTTHEFYPWLRSAPETLHVFGGISTNKAVFELLAAAIDDVAQPAMRKHCGHQASPLQRVLVLRILELPDGVRAGQVRGLISFPTWTTGSIAPADLLSRLCRARDDGWSPQAYDLDLALLRLDTADSDREELCDELRRIGTPATERAAAWLETGGPATPTMHWSELERSSWDYEGNKTALPSLLTTRPVADEACSDYGDAWRALTQQQREASYEGIREGLDQPRSWPMVLPQHRELVAANAADALAYLPECSDRAEILPLLAEADGPVGDALHLCIGYALSAKLTSARADAVDALLILAARGQLDGRALGHVLGHLTTRQNIIPARILGPLRDAASAGASIEITQTLTALISDILRSDAKPPSGFADLLALATETVEASGQPVDIECLDALAERRGSSRQLVEARRLKALITP